MCQICNGVNLSNQTKIEIQICPHVRKIPYISGVKWLEIIQCKNLEYIPPIDGLLVLVIIGCPNIRELPNIPTLKGLKLQCKNLFELPMYNDLERLELHNESVGIIPQYPKLKTLYLNHVSTIEVPYFPYLLELEIHNSKKLMSISDKYQYLYKICIQSCPKFIAFNNLNKVLSICHRIDSESYITNCPYFINKKFDETYGKYLQLSDLGLKLKNIILNLEK